MIEMTCHVNHFFDTGDDVISLESRPLNFHAFIHAYSLRTADVFPVVASLLSYFQREKSDYRKYVYCSQANTRKACYRLFIVPFFFREIVEIWRVLCTEGTVVLTFLQDGSP